MTNPHSSSTADIALDAVDQSIIDLLRIDGRMAFTEISKRLNIPEATARYRVQRLLQSKVIQITAWPNPDKIGKSHVMTLLFTIENGWIDQVAQELAGMEEVRFVAIFLGRYNIIADVYFGVHDDLIAFFEKLHHMKGIITYESQTILKLLKAEYEYVIR
ncbi:Lrp/AsnC family transcriptional regulator [Oculatella sp. LEGE 06141]|uniref:Lrp/AsnC family transcriptional regulator n=1 Tax=Oculatella sp. LEGE 06141 TaxID=1828648 RepID=UPI00187F9D49|nr:Lrp/AsnC family transcriptional regulator [Oculatella sp. LEGE 06141]MBE9178050.1 Lrp/AsnC family transcriptional regulator [Oculatella sp. LEGE 06141]